MKDKVCPRCGALVIWSQRFHCWVCTRDCGWHCTIYPEASRKRDMPKQKSLVAKKAPVANPPKACAWCIHWDWKSGFCGTSIDCSTQVGNGDVPGRFLDIRGTILEELQRKQNKIDTQEEVRQ